MLPYIRSIEDMINLGYKPGKFIKTKDSKGRSELWVKIAMNGSDEQFYVLSRRK